MDGERRGSLRPLARVAAALVAAALAGCASTAGVVQRLDEGHAELCRELGEVVDRVDRVFGEPRVEDRERIVRAKVGFQVEGRENDGPSYTVPVSLRLPLPALERTANVFLQFDSVADASGDLDQAGRSLDENKTLSATILRRRGPRLDTGARLELYWDGGPQTGLRPFLRWQREWERYQFRIEQQVSYVTDKHFGLRGIAQLDRAMGETAFLRLFTVVSADQETPSFAAEHGVAYRRSFADGRVVLSAETGVAYSPYDGDPGTRERGAAADPDEGYARVRVIGKLFRPWIEYEIAPAAHAPWRHDDRSELGITFTLRVISESRLSGPQAEAGEGCERPTPAP